EESGHAETIRVEVPRVGEGLAEVARSRDADRPRLGETHEGLEVSLERAHAVADATHAELAELGEVLTHLGGVEREARRDLVGRGGVDTGCLEAAHRA